MTRDVNWWSIGLGGITGGDDLFTSDIPGWLNFPKSAAIANSRPLLTAYWIAFGPHGPRALDPPGEGKSLIFHTILVLGATLGIFSVIRMFGGQSPDTMNREYQEASNEYLKVYYLPPTPPFIPEFQLLTLNLPETTLRAPDWLRLGGLQGPRHGPVPPRHLNAPASQPSYHT